MTSSSPVQTVSKNWRMGAITGLREVTIVGIEDEIYGGVLFHGAPCLSVWTRPVNPYLTLS